MVNLTNMGQSKYILVLLLFIIPFSGSAQSNETYFLKWKLKPHEVITYKTIMQSTDTSANGDAQFDGLSKMMGVEKDSSITKKMRQNIKVLAKSLKDNESNLVTHLFENRVGVVDIEMRVDDKKTDNTASKKKDDTFQNLFAKMTTGVMLRGRVYEDGTIESFYIANDQKNLIAMFFELPGHPVKLGDSWPLTMHFISMDQNFKCDSSYKRNVVKVVGVDTRNNDQIVILKYDIVEYVSGEFYSPFNNENQKLTMKMVYNATGSFSLEKGRWINYDGMMSTENTGIMDVKAKKKFALIAE